MWETEAVPLLQLLINDMDDTVRRYTDERLETVLLRTALMVKNDSKFAADYIIDLDAGSFVNLMVLKAACFILRNEATQAAGQGIDIQDGSSRISLRGMVEGKMKVADDACGNYDIGLRDLARGAVAGAIILGPYRAFGGYARSYPNDGRYR
jgi:hypothetical protein